MATRVPTPDPALKNTWRSRDEIIASTRARAAQNRVPTPPTQTVPAPRTEVSSTTTRVPTPVGSVAPTPTVPTPPNYRDQVNELLGQYRQLASTPVQYDPESDPRYQAYRTLAQQQADQASRRAMERMNERGILNSSLTSNQLGQIEQQAEQQALAAIPQFYEQAYAQRQAELSNLGNLINMYAGQDDTMFGRGVTEAGLTGQYVPQQARPIIDQLLSLKREAERPGLAPEVYQQYQSQGDQLRNQLRAMGVDPSFIESNITSTEAAQQIPNVFATLQARGQQFDQDMARQQMEYQAARDAIMDERWKQQFDEDVRRFGLNYALDRQIRQGNLDVARMNAATSRMNANISAGNLALRQSQESQTQDARTVQSEIMNEMAKFSSPTEAREWLNANAGYITSQLGAEGLQQMYRMAETLFPTQVDTSAQEQARQREQAIRMAQSDPNWSFADAQQREQLIQQYMSMIGG